MDTPAEYRILRVAVLADRRLFRDSLTACLDSDPDLSVVGHAATAEDLLDLCGLRGPEILLLSVDGGVDGTLDAAAAVREKAPATRIVVIYERLSPTELAHLWRLGVDTLVPSSHGLDALRVVLRGYATSPAASPPPPAAELTDREREIITLISAGHTVFRIAELLDTSAHAVENQKRRIYRKLGVSSQSQAVARAAALGIAERSPLFPARPARAGAPMIVLRGSDSPARQKVVVTLLAHRIPFELEGVAAGEAPPRPSTWDRGPVLLMLVDPTPAEWPAPDAPPVPIVLVHCVEPGPAEMVAGIGRGVAAVVPAARIAEDLVAALTLAARGYLVVDGEDARSMFAALVSRRAPSGLPELTARESDILHSIALGHTVRQTARALGIAEKTVENTQARLFRKLGARNRTGALAAAHALGLVEAVESRTQVAPSAPSWALRAPLPSLAGDTDVGVGPA